MEKEEIPWLLLEHNYVKGLTESTLHNLDF